MKLIEVFDSKPESIEWKKGADEWRGLFVIDDFPMFMLFEKYYKGKWTVSFGMNKKGKMPEKNKAQIHGKGTHSITGTGNQGKVFSTVLSGLKYFSKSEKPDTLQFSAEEASRMKLYKRMIKKFAGSFGYVASESDGRDYELNKK
jgi:hypothetical protein